ncbi:oxygenase MpaB family protein [Gordonia sp. ABSL1-1]|uniref:oxygenase MpaB family protein n=1 Tax=Gordonia sp. ABSL1-1 TaxID=3053923 RepID=UPI002572659F|nr:oxygenase MpaB family protein [Gordonia sp. ABSL1-1]MDL9935933.1 oxygenase MpaB family protein [Gordonia sp. ABSL1-1]
MTAVHDKADAAPVDPADEVLPGGDHLINNADDEIELISPDSLTAELTGHFTFLPVNGAAFVMQVMHPIIGDVVDKYSVFRTDPLGRAIRSTDSVMRWIYGGTEALEEGKRLRKMHQPLQMRNADGKHISALNPEAYAWVIATAFPTLLSSAPLLVGRQFSVVEQRELLEDNRRIAKIVQVPMKGYPTTVEEFGEYFDDFVENKLVRHPVAVELIEQMQAAPAIPRNIPARRLVTAIAAKASIPLQRFNYLTTVGVMDPRVREILGVTWSDDEQRQLERMHAVVRGAYRVLPERVTYFPLAYHARRHHDAIVAMKKREKQGAAYAHARRGVE